MTRTSARAFVDTNVLVYAVDDADPSKRDRARELLGHEPERLVVSTQVLAEFFVVTTRKIARPLPEADAAEAVEQLSKLAVVGADAGLVRSAIATSLSARLSLWDALIIEAAHVAGCQLVFSEDLAAGAKIGATRIENPFA